MLIYLMFLINGKILFHFQIQILFPKTEFIKAIDFRLNIFYFQWQILLTDIWCSYGIIFIFNSFWHSIRRLKVYFS